MKKKSEKEYIYVRITESLYCTLETNTTFLINYTSIKITEIKKKKFLSPFTLEGEQILRNEVTRGN